VTAAGRDEEIQANWHRAQDSLAAAQVLLDTGHPDVAAARAYYAAFYAACADCAARRPDTARRVS
jgi:uncharacterized protein (UPF0332 family)